VTHLPCRAVCVRHVTVCDRPVLTVLPCRFASAGTKMYRGKSRSEILKP
jgi:hypothetical protein